MKNNMIIVTVLLVVVGAVAGFFGGVKYQESKTGIGQGETRNFNGQFPNRNGTGNQGQQAGIARTGGFRGGQIMGEIISVDDKTITVKLQDGSSKIILYSQTTTIGEMTTLLPSELKTGVKVGVFGITNTDGSVTAQNIQLNPVFRTATGSGSPRP